MPAVSWRRNQFAVTAASFMGFMGFTIVMPFLPLYLGQLGARDVGEIAMWAGLSLGATPAVTAALSPFWGRVADRFGRKVLVQRSLLSFALIMAAMAWATRPWHILALRAVQGVFAGYGGLTVAMAAESAPPDRMVRAIGLVQTAQRVGPALGPLVGGAVAGLVGLRQAFFVTSASYVAALLLVSVFYTEPSHVRSRGPLMTVRRSWRSWLGMPGFARVMAVIFLVTFVDRSLGPVLPLWIGEQGVSDGYVPVAAGVLFSSVALGAVLGNSLSEVGWRVGGAGRVVLGAAAAGAAALVVVLRAGPHVWVLAGALLVFGAAMGAVSTVSYAEGGRSVPPEAHGEGFGYLNAANLVGLAASPVVAGLLAQGRLVWVFAIDLAVLCLVAALAAPTTRRP